MAWDEALTRLNTILAELYPEQPRARRIADMAGVSVAHISFSPAAIDNWYAILQEAEKQAKTPMIAEVALNEYPAHGELQAAIEGLRRRSAAGSLAVAAPPREFSHQDKLRLRDMLIKHGTLEDLRTICNNLAIDYESVPGGDNKSAKARELVAFCDRRMKLPQLVAACQEVLPEVGW